MRLQALEERLLRTALLVLALCIGLSAYASELVFDAASIKPSPPLRAIRGPFYFGPRGGPGTDDAGRYSCDFCDVAALVSQAFEVPDYQIFSANRLPEDRFHVVATIPAATTREQFRTMLQNLLVERFKLTVHRESREMQMFRLVVASGGPKLKAHVATSKDTIEPTGHVPGFHYRLQGRTMEDFRRVVEGQLRKPVTDATGLNGQYDFDLWWTTNYLDADAGNATDAPTIYSAIQSVGLKLEARKGQIEVVVIDHVEKSPTEN
jgi:uncharacterized protein (TIGR03435 family)